MRRRRRRLTPKLRRLLAEAAEHYYLSRGRLIPVPNPIFVRNREGEGWAIRLRRQGEQVNLPLPPEAEQAISQRGNKQAAIVHRNGTWRLYLAIGEDRTSAKRRLRQQLAEALAEDLGLGPALRLADRFRKHGPLIFHRPGLERPGLEMPPGPDEPPA